MAAAATGVKKVRVAVAAARAAHRAAGAIYICECKRIIFVAVRRIYMYLEYMEGDKPAQAGTAAACLACRCTVGTGLGTACSSAASR